MLIGIDASRAAVARRTGTENYSLHLIRELLSLDQDSRYRLYFNQAPPTGLLPAVAEMRIMSFPRVWTHVRLSWEMMSSPPDVLFVPSHVLPIIYPRRTVVTIHDLGYHYHPEAHTLFQNIYLRWSTRHNARVATRVLVDSQATRRDLERYYGTPEGKIEVVYPGRDESLAEVTDAQSLAEVQARYGLSECYFLYVGTLHPRKNLARLVQAFAAAVQSLASNSQHQMSQLQLVLAGQKGWSYEEIDEQIRRLDLSDRVVLTGYVPDEDLSGLLSGALAFVLPSLYEGFGLPVLEAMACGTPVVCSGVSSLPEVAGDAALLVDPTDTEDIAQALYQVALDEALRRTLVERGWRRVERFSWRRCAQETWQILKDVGHGLG